MAPRRTSLVAALGLILSLALFTAPAPTPAPVDEAPINLSAYNDLVQTTARASWPRQPASEPDERLTVLVQLDSAPMAMVGRDWDQPRRAAYGAELGAAQARLARRVEAMGGAVLARYSHAAAGLAVSIAADAIAALGALPEVAAVVRIGDYAASQADPIGPVATQAELAALIGADEVRRRGNDGAGIEIAIVDTGVDYTHVKLGGSGDPAAYSRAICGVPAPGATGCSPGFSPPADLFPNLKVRGGLDLVGDIWPNPDPNCGDQAICPFPDPNPIDLDGHGTHVADIAAGLPTAPGGADVGVAPGANLWAFKACNGQAALCSGPALLSAIDAALDLDRSDSGGCSAGAACRPYDPADIIVLALSFNYGQPEDAVTLFANLAGHYGSLVVAAAGNAGDKPFIIGSPATAAAALAVAESRFPGAGGAPAASEAMAADASRGPRINDNALKPDLAAPGAISSARAGGGASVEPFGGASGAAPVAAGVAALLVQELEEKGALDPSPGLADGPDFELSLAPLVKTILMNSASGELAGPGGGLAPLSLQGAGRVSAQGAFLGRTLAVEATAMLRLLDSSPELKRCTIRPYQDLLVYRLLGEPPPCAALYPGGEPLFQAWNAQAGSVSFGYRPAVGDEELTRQVVVYNFSRQPRSYSLSTGLRLAEDAGRGVELSVSPASLELAGGSAEIVTLTLKLSPRTLREWTINGGELGNRGSATCSSALPERDCPSLTLFEVDGALRIDGGTNNRVSVPVHVLPRRVADVTVSRVDAIQVQLSNRSAFMGGAVAPFALVDISPDKCDTRDAICTSMDYTPGDRPGSAQSPVDLRYVGLRSYQEPGLNSSLGLPAAPAGALADELVEFAVTVYDKPYRASPNFPVRLEVHIDADADRVVDYVVYNADLGGGTDGRSRVFVRDVNPNDADGTRPTAQYRFTVAGFNTQSWVLPVPAMAVGLRSDRPFRFYVVGLDAYFQGEGATAPWDCSPGPLSACGALAHTMQTGALRFRPAATALTVPPEGRSSLIFSEDAGGDLGSPAQIGLLLLYRDALPGLEAESVRLR